MSIQYGQLYLEFSRTAPSLLQAILSAIQNVRQAAIGAEVARVDACDLVTQADIARRIGRSRQLVHQYITGERGPRGFPPPACYLTEKAPLWAWCAVGYWLLQNDMIKPEEVYEAEVVAAINNALELLGQQKRNPALVDEVKKAVALV